MHSTLTYASAITISLVFAVASLWLLMWLVVDSIAGITARSAAPLICASILATLMDSESNAIAMVAGVLLIIELAFFCVLGKILWRRLKQIRHRSATP